MRHNWESGNVTEEQSFGAGRRHLHQGQGTKHGISHTYCRITVPLPPSITKMYLKQVTALGINICLHLLHHCSYLLIISNNSTNMCRHVLKHGRHRQQQQRRFFQGQVIYIVVLLSLALALALDRSLLRI